MNNEIINKLKKYFNSVFDKQTKYGAESEREYLKSFLLEDSMKFTIDKKDHFDPTVGTELFPYLATILNSRLISTVQKIRKDKDYKKEVLKDYHKMLNREKRLKFLIYLSIK